MEFLALTPIELDALCYRKREADRREAMGWRFLATVTAQVHGKNVDYTKDQTATSTPQVQDWRAQKVYVQGLNEMFGGKDLRK